MRLLISGNAASLNELIGQILDRGELISFAQPVVQMRSSSKQLLFAQEIDSSFGASVVIKKSPDPYRRKSRKNASASIAYIFGVSKTNPSVRLFRTARTI